MSRSTIKQFGGLVVLSLLWGVSVAGFVKGTQTGNEDYTLLATGAVIAMAIAGISDMIYDAVYGKNPMNNSKKSNSKLNNVKSTRGFFAVLIGIAVAMLAGYAGLYNILLTQFTSFAAMAVIAAIASFTAIIVGVKVLMLYVERNQASAN